MVACQTLQQNRGLLQDRLIDLDIAKAGSRRCERGLSKTGVRETVDLLRRGAKNICGDIAEIPELGVVDSHRLLLAQAAQRLAVLLGEPAALLGTLTISARETAREIRTLGRRRRHLRRSSPLWSGSAHDPIVARAVPQEPFRAFFLYPCPKDQQHSHRGQYSSEGLLRSCAWSGLIDGSHAPRQAATPCRGAQTRHHGSHEAQPMKPSLALTPTTP